MHAPDARQRSRILTADLKAQLCSLVAQSNTLESSASAIGVSLRTVQRERKLDDQFDRDVRRALGASPDPLKLMETAARTHWRAAAWLLERSRPEQYGRRPSNAASHARVSRALSSVLNAVLEKLPPEQRAEMLTHVTPAVEQSLASCFPQRTSNFRPDSPAAQLPIPQPAPSTQETKTSPPTIIQNVAPPSGPVSSDPGTNVTIAETAASCSQVGMPNRQLTNNERKRRQRQAAQLSRKMKKATRRQNRRAA